MTKRRHPTSQEFEDELRKQPVGYWDNGTVRHPVNYSSLIRERERLHKIAQMIECPKCGYKPEEHDSGSDFDTEEELSDCQRDNRKLLAEVGVLKKRLAAQINEWRVSIVSPTPDDPFRRIDCRIVDVGYADKAIVVEAVETSVDD